MYSYRDAYICQNMKSIVSKCVGSGYNKKLYV